MTDSPPKVEVMASVQRRRRWSAAEKMRMVEATYAPAASVCSVARQHGVKAAPSDIALAMSLLLYTVQRPSDVRHMTAGQVREMHDRLWLVLRQEKTNELVAVPCHRALEGPRGVVLPKSRARRSPFRKTPARKPAVQPAPGAWSGRARLDSA
ncbi:transposase [Roseomonas frigidaquae]|uniref:Transposase n=2 Tax=Falsiroseomonas frigidaquae TaxID=487318 RepID=A0ABX1EV20_9PROT|nr:transposase [Falsiroseomonas frigidaquae]